MMRSVEHRINAVRRKYLEFVSGEPAWERILVLSADVWKKHLKETGNYKRLGHLSVNEGGLMFEGSDIRVYDDLPKGTIFYVPKYKRETEDE